MQLIKCHNIGAIMYANTETRSRKSRVILQFTFDFESLWTQINCPSSYKLNAVNKNNCNFLQNSASLLRSWEY